MMQQWSSDVIDDAIVPQCENVNVHNQKTDSNNSSQVCDTVQLIGTAWVYCSNDCGNNRRVLSVRTVLCLLRRVLWDSP